MPDENKQSYVTLSEVHTISVGVISSYIGLSDAITTVCIICYQLLTYAKHTILANFVEILLRLFCDITVCYRNLWVSKDILENWVKSCYFTLPFAISRCPLTIA